MVPKLNASERLYWADNNTNDNSL